MGAIGRTHRELPQTMNWSCGFGEDTDSPRCGQPSTLHGLIVRDGSILAAMSCCAEHGDVMRLSATWVHEMDSPCALPGSLFYWPENECRLPDELSADAALEAATTMPATSGLIELR